MEHSSLENCIKLLLMGGLTVTTVNAVAKQVDNGNINSSLRHTPVTGTRIAQGNESSALPVTIYTREDILHSGESNAADFIRSLPVNSFGSSRPGSGLSETTETNVSMFGLGASRTLVLIDGKRLPRSPITGSSQDISLIPMNVVESIEIYTSGHATKFGSDALAGVINVNTRKDFQGAEIMLGSGQPSLPKNGGEREEGYLTFGTSSEKVSIISGISWLQQEPVYRIDLPWRIPRNSVFGTNFTTITDGQDDLNFTAISNACDFHGSPFYLSPRQDSLSGDGICAYDATFDYADEPEIENKSLFSKATYQLNQHWQLEAFTLYARQISNHYSVPATYSSFYADSPLSSDNPNNPTNPLSPLFDATLNLSPQPINWWHGFTLLGNHNKTSQSDLMDTQLNINGQWSSTQLAFGLRHSTNDNKQVSRNNLLHENALSAIESGTYSLLNPNASSQDQLNALKVTTYREGKYNQNELFANLSYSGFELSAGQIRLAAGFEYRDEKYSDQHDPLSLAGAVNGGFTEVRNRFADHQTIDTFFESNVPIFDQLDLNLSHRYSNSSLFNAASASKISLNYQPFDSLSFYASASQDFAYPSLFQAPENDHMSLQTFRFVPSCVIAPQTTSCYITVPIVERFPSSLNAEKSDSFQLSIKYTPLDRFELNLTYFKSKIKNTIRFISAEYLALTDFISESYTPDGLGCLSSLTGGIRSCVVGYSNLGTQSTDGFHVSLAYNFEVYGGSYQSRWHSVHLHNNSTTGIKPLESGGFGYFQRLADDPSNQVGQVGKPKHRAQWSHQYAKNNWDLSYQLNLIGKQATVTEYYGDFHVPTWVTHDLQFNYHSSWQGKITLGMKNFTAKKPPLDKILFTFDRYQTELYNPFGRIVYARYTQIF